MITVQSEKSQLLDLRKINFTMIENELIDNEDLSIYEKMTYIVLCRFAREGQCFPKYETIGKRVGCSKRKAIDTVKSLINKGLVSKQHRKNEYGEHTSNIYYINGFVVGSAQDAPPLVNEMHHPSEQGAPKQDIYNNTNNKKSVSQSDLENIDTPKKSDPKNDKQEIKQIITQSQVDLYEDEPLKEVIKEVIKEAYQDKTTRQTIKKLKLNHIDRAIGKFRAMQEQQDIKNPKLYFLKCLLSAIDEEGLTNLF